MNKPSPKGVGRAHEVPGRVEAVRPGVPQGIDRGDQALEAVVDAGGDGADRVRHRDDPSSPRWADARESYTEALRLDPDLAHRQRAASGW